MPQGETRRRFLVATGAVGTALLAGCVEFGSNTGDGTGQDGMDDGMSEGMDETDPANAPRVAIDRFSDAAGPLMVRSGENDLPGPGDPIDFDEGPFLTHGLGPDGTLISYYNFDVRPRQPAPIYALFREGEDTPVEGRLNIVGVVPDDEGYNDFWHVQKVTVPGD